MRVPEPKTLLRVAIGVALLTMALKILAWWFTGSVALLSDAMESLVNWAGAVFALGMLVVAARPADDDHPYGHHKAEYFASGFEGLLIVAAALIILGVSVQRFWQPQALQALDLGLFLSVLSSVFNGALAWLMLRSARLHSSIALEADGRHLLTDVWTSLGVVVGIVGVYSSGWLWLDPLVAVVVALNILREGGRLVWRSSQGLMDQALDLKDIAKIEAVLRNFSPPEAQPADRALIHFAHLSTRRAGQRKFADMHMYIPGNWTLGQAVALRSCAEEAVMEAIPGLKVSIQLLPSDVEVHPVA